MIYRLRKKFIGICILSFVAVFVAVIALIYVTTAIQTNRTLDRHADVISQNDGKFPDFNQNKPNDDRPMPPDGFNRESPFTTRYFTVRFDNYGSIISADMQQIASVTPESAESYAKSAIKAGRERGWIDDYRYKVCGTDDGTFVVFVSGISAKENNQSFMLITLSAFALCSIAIIVMIILISKKAVKPTAESYEKQKQFITNANHELKTPLTLIRTNLDILESEMGSSDWLSDIRDETLLMSDLVNRMVSLARMDEDEVVIQKQKFNLSDATEETVSMFVTAIKSSERHININISSQIMYNGDEKSIRQIISILMDNALKYCDSGGEIKVSLLGDKRPILKVENSYSAVSNIDLELLFDRFYRADKARTYGNGFGIGLSMAKAIAEKHGGNITAYNVENKIIGFKVKL